MKKNSGMMGFIIGDIIVIILKLVAGYFGKSLTVLSTIIFDVVVLFTTLMASLAKEENKKYKSVLSSLYSFLIVLLGIFMIYMVFRLKVWKPSLLILIFLLLCVVINYVVTVYKSNVGYMKKEGILGYGNKNSNLNLILYIICLATIIFSKLKGLWSYFKYADLVGVIVVSLIIIYYALRILIRSFKNLEDEEIKVSKEINEEVNKCKEVKNVTKVGILNIGGIKRIDLELKLQEGIALQDLITFVVTLEDFLLKFSDLASVRLVKNVSRKVVRKNARNSGSTNSKGSTKKKSTKKKNKKR